MNFEEIYLARRSNRFLKSDPLDKTTIDKLVKAGSYAPVGRGRYEDHKLYVVEGKKLKDLQKIITDEYGRDSTFGSGLLILVLSKEEKPELANQNAGCILTNICLEAASLGLGSVYVYSTAAQIKESKKALDLLKVEKGYSIIAGATIGYKASEEVRDVAHKIEVVR